MNIRFLIDLVFFVLTTGGIAFGGYHGLHKAYDSIRRECLTSVQQGLPKMEKFTQKLTGKKLDF